MNFEQFAVFKAIQNEACDEIVRTEDHLKNIHTLTLDNVFHEPVGFYLLNKFLSNEHANDKVKFKH